MFTNCFRLNPLKIPFPQRPSRGILLELRGTLTANDATPSIPFQEYSEGRKCPNHTTSCYPYPLPTGCKFCYLNRDSLVTKKLLWDNSLFNEYFFQIYFINAFWTNPIFEDVKQGTNMLISGAGGGYTLCSQTYEMFAKSHHQGIGFAVPNAKNIKFNF
jgi:hypothetical protein